MQKAKRRRTVINLERYKGKLTLIQSRFPPLQFYNKYLQHWIKHFSTLFYSITHNNNLFQCFVYCVSSNRKLSGKYLVHLFKQMSFSLADLQSLEIVSRIKGLVEPNYEKQIHFFLLLCHAYKYAQSECFNSHGKIPVVNDLN